MGVSHRSHLDTTYYKIDNKVPRFCSISRLGFKQKKTNCQAREKLVLLDFVGSMMVLTMPKEGQDGWLKVGLTAEHKHIICYRFLQIGDP